MKPILPLFILWLAVLSSPKGSAQNLVPNGDFETYNNCPANLSGIGFSNNYSSFPTVSAWVNPLKNSTPDYLNSCAPSGTGVKVPATVFGYQLPYNGQAYAGIIAWDGQFSGGVPIFDYREYIQNRLTQQLLPGHRYCVTFYVNPTITGAFSFNYVGIDQVGLNFSSTQTLNVNDYTLSLPVQVSNPQGNFLTDTSRWYKVNGVYTATGGEQWITAGCFKNNNSLPGFAPIYPSTPDPGLSYRCYLYLDGFDIHEILPSDTIRRAHDTLVCQPGGLSLPLSGLAGAGGYQWSTGSFDSAIVAADTGIYWCRSAVECGMVIDSFHIRYVSTPVLDLGKDTFNCLSQPITLSSNNNYSSYLWNTGAATPSITVSHTGDYILEVTSYCGKQKDTIHVSIQGATPPPVVSDTSICQGVDEPQLGVDGSNIRWYSSLSSTYGIPLQPIISTSQYGDFTWYVTQTIGQCESPRVPLHLKIIYKPNVDIGDYYSLCANTDTVSIGREYPGVNYLWNTNEVVCCIIPHEMGTYQLTISNECGTSSDTAFVEISSCDDCLFLPNAFTPNGDGRNDQFLPILKCPVTDYKMSIFNRWGEQVFATENINQGWTGRVNGHMLDDGAYVFVMEFRSVTTGLKKQVKGNVTLLR